MFTPNNKLKKWCVELAPVTESFLEVSRKMAPDRGCAAEAEIALPSIHVLLGLQNLDPTLHVSTGSTVIRNVADSTNTLFEDWPSKTIKPTSVSCVEDPTEGHSNRLLVIVSHQLSPSNRQPPDGLQDVGEKPHEEGGDEQPHETSELDCSRSSFLSLGEQGLFGIDRSK